MNKDELEKRQERAQTEQFIVAKTDDGYRVCSPLTPAVQFVISGIPGHPVCTCPDFQDHVSDLDWRCKHILAVEQYQRMQNHHAENGDAGNPVPSGAPAPAEPPKTRKPAGRNGDAQMLIKRSVSPDGRIDSLSVEFSCPVGKTTTEEIKQLAEKTLKLQSEIVQGFLKSNGNKALQPAVSQTNQQNGAVPAQLLGVGGMDGKWGRRLFLNVLVNGQTLAKYFGSDKQLTEALSAAGFPNLAPQLREGVQFNLPCQVVTRPNGKYLNIERVLPSGG